MHRNTYVEIDLEGISNNVKRVIEYAPNYQYYFGVVKADAYGHGVEIVKTLLESGINYLAVATLDEAIEIRNHFKEIPILCLGYISPQYFDLCEREKITITISTLEEAKRISTKNVKCHIKIDTGMHRLGVSKREEYLEIYQLLKKQVEGVYTHIYDAPFSTEKQFEKFEEIVINRNEIPIIHICASEALYHHEKKEYENGCRLGIIMYGLLDTQLELQSTFKLVSEVIQIHELDAGETVGYGGTYKAIEPTKIGVIPIGYADGIIRKNSGRMVYIHDKPYPIVGRVCMDMLFVKIDDIVSLHDKVEVLRDKEHIIEVSKYLETIPYEVICSIGKRVPRVWRNRNDE